MKSTNVKAMVAKVMTVGLLAGAFVMAAPAKADAQQFGAVVEVGYPHLDYSRRDYYERQRIEAIRRHDEWLRHEEWLRSHRYYGWR
jgi:hypothetical protein